MKGYLKKFGLFAMGAGAGMFLSQYHTKPPTLLKWYLGKDNFPAGINLEAFTKKTSKQLSLNENNLAITIKAQTGHMQIEEIYTLLQSAYSRNSDDQVIAENFALANISMSDVARNRNDLHKPETYFRKAQEIISEIPDGSLSTSTLLTVGYSLQKAFSFDKEPDLITQAIATYEKAIKRDTKNKVLFCLLGEAYMQQISEVEICNSSDTVQKAILSLKKAISIDASYGLAHFRLAEAYIKAENYELAEQHMSQSFDIFKSKGPNVFPKEFQRNDAESLFKIAPDHKNARSPGL